MKSANYNKCVMQEYTDALVSKLGQVADYPGCGGSLRKNSGIVA